jgi:hypothetical protein
MFSLSGVSSYYHRRNLTFFIGSLCEWIFFLGGGRRKTFAAALHTAPSTERRAVSFAAHRDGRSAPVRLNLLSPRSALLSSFSVDPREVQKGT